MIMLANTIGTIATTNQPHRGLSSKSWMQTSAPYMIGTAIASAIRMNRRVPPRYRASVRRIDGLEPSAQRELVPSDFRAPAAIMWSR